MAGTSNVRSRHGWVFLVALLLGLPFQAGRTVNADEGGKTTKQGASAYVLKAPFGLEDVGSYSPADRFDMGGDENAISDSAKRGLALFQGKARCTRCHSGFNFTDEKFHNLGIDWDKQEINLGAIRSLAIRRTSVPSKRRRSGKLSGPI